MTAILVTLLLVVVGIRLGAIVFQSAYVAPVVFTVLDEAAASRFLRSLFPRFFKLGIGCGAAGGEEDEKQGTAHGFSRGGDKFERRQDI